MLKILFNLFVHILYFFFIVKKIFKLKKRWKYNYTVNFFAILYFFNLMLVLCDIMVVIRIISDYSFFFFVCVFLFFGGIIFLVLFFAQIYKDQTAEWWTCIYELIHFKISNNFSDYNKLGVKNKKYFLILDEVWKFPVFSYLLLIFRVLILIFLFFFFFYVNNLVLINLLDFIYIYRTKFFIILYFILVIFLFYYSLYAYSSINCYYFRSLDFYTISGSIDRLENSTNYLQCINFIDMKNDIYMDSLYPLDDWHGLKTNPMSECMQVTFDSRETYLRMSLPHEWIKLKNYIWDSQRINNPLYEFNRKIDTYCIEIFNFPPFKRNYWIRSWLECHKRYEKDLK